MSKWTYSEEDEENDADAEKLAQRQKFTEHKHKLIEFEKEDNKKFSKPPRKLKEIPENE